mmetsp:Transcript_8391/g.30950  ORF Transcript_8391/g.30950 Transcript_8391/m.30950 type:complete len:106 (+) Transcript_8391:36-353(+)
MAEARAALRLLLRTVRQKITRRTPNSNPLWEDHIVEEFRTNKELADPAKVRGKILLARETAHFISAVDHHKSLLQSYNISVDRDTSRKLQQTASRVGLAMPGEEK